MRLEGRVALVTGAGSGIGEATARRFAREGAIVVVNDVDLERARPVAADLQRTGARALSVAADVTRRAEVEAMVNHVVGEFGRLDVLVNNAGINRDAMSHKMTEEQWDQVLTVNLKGTFLCAQAALVRMREKGWGRVINTSSIGSLGNIGQANYSASKAGVIGLTRTLALEYAKFGITVNCVAPGPVITRMLAGVPEADPREDRRAGCRPAASPTRRRSPRSTRSSPRRTPPSSRARSSSSTAACPSGSDAGAMGDGSTEALFEAIRAGDLGRVTALLDREPALVRARGPTRRDARAAGLLPAAAGRRRRPARPRRRPRRVRGRRRR